MIKEIKEIKKVTAVILLILYFLSFPAWGHVILGNPKGDITIVEFLDYACPHCRNIAVITGQIISKNPDIRVVQRIIPAHGEQSIYLDSLVLASANQDKLEGFIQSIASITKPITINNIEHISEKLNIDIKKLYKDANNKSIKDELSDNLLLFGEMGYSKVPQILIGQSRVNAAVYRFSGEISYAKLQQIIDKLRRNKS